MAVWQEAFNVNRILCILLLLPILTKGFQDDRCYLDHDGSSENFFVVEDVPVGDTIGTVRVIGDPSPIVGSISLRLKESDSPIDIASGSKNLTLKRPLDKEGIDGPSSVAITLICDRLETLDPSFEIPINIRVTDANDNAPYFINAPYVLNISEVTVVGTRVLQGVHATDDDQEGPFSTVRYSVLPGPNSSYFEFENELEGTLVLKKPLDYETLKTFDVYIRAQDAGNPPKSVDTVLTVHVVDADDQNPRFLDDRYNAVVPYPAVKNTVLKILPRDIRAVDQDEGIRSPIYYTWNSDGPEYAMFRLDRQTGKVTLAKTFGENDLHNPATLVIRATQQDNPDRYTLATLTVTRASTQDIKFTHPVFNFRVSEGLSPGASIGSLSNNRPGHHLKYYVSDQSVLSVFAINTLGEVSLKNKLDYENKTEYIFKVFATDGKTNDSSVVNVTLENVNEWEPRFRYPHYEFSVGMNGGLHDFVGKIEAADGDRGDRLTLSLSGADESMFYIKPNGELMIKDIKDLQGSTATLTVTATDSGDPPKKTSVPVTVHFPGFSRIAAAGVAATKSSGSGPMLLAGLGIILLLLSLVVAVLAAYIYKVRRKGNAGQIGDLNDRALQKTHISNPVFSSDKMRPGTAVALGGIPSESKSRLPSPKVHPAPQPPANDLWPTSAGRVKKLSWGDKTESGSIEDLEELDTIPKVLESNNLTVYF